MKPVIFLSLIIILLTASCGRVPESITNGEWNYTLTVNGVEAGSAVITNTTAGDRFISSTAMYLSMGTIKSSTIQTVTETLDFKPLQLDISNTIEDSSTGNRQVISKKAVISANNITLTSDGITAKYIIDKPFIIDGNYITDRLIKERFREGVEIRAHMYEPTVETDRTILVIVNVIGRETITSGGNRIDVIHVKERVEKLKSVDIYINENGIMEKTVIKMLNNIFILERVR